MTMVSTMAPARVECVVIPDDLDACYRLWSGEVAALFTARGVPPHDVDDLVQVTFLGLHLRWDRCPPEVRKATLLAIAHNKYVDYIRRGTVWRNFTLPMADLPDEPPCMATDPAAVVVRLDQLRQVRLAVGREEPRLRRLVHERYVADRPYKDIADELGTTAGALRNSMARTHDRLRSRLAALDVRSVMPSIPSLPWLGWRWARRGTVPPWAVAAGHAGFVSLVATTLVMAPPSAVPAAAAPATDVAVTSSVRDIEATPVERPRTARPDAVTTVQTRPTGTTDDNREAVDYGRNPVPLPVPTLSLPPAPEPPCVGYCEKPAETVTIHVPGTGEEVSQDQNVAPVCRHVPREQSAVTCHEDEGTNYAVSPPPRLAEE